MGNQTWQRRLLLLLSGLCVLALVGQTLLFTARWLNAPFAGFFVYENLIVGPYYAPGWSGAAAGLRSLDRLVSIDGQELRNRAQFYERIGAAAPGTIFKYGVLRNGKTIDLNIPSLEFTFRDWLLTFGMYMVIGLAFLFIGVAPYFYRASSAVALPLCFMVLLVFVWFQTTFDFMTDGLLPKEIRIFSLALTPSAAVHLALLLRNLNIHSTPRRFQLLAIYGAGAMIGALNSAAFFLAPSIWIPIYRMSYVFVCLGALVFLLLVAKALRESQSDLDRSRLRVMMVGALAGFLIPALGTTAAAIFEVLIPYNIALIPTIFFPISIAYALLKYSLFDLSNVLKVALSRIGLIASLVAIYAIVALLVAPWAGQHAKDPLVPIFFSILVVGLFNPLLHWMERVVDRYIYRQDYDPAMAQAEISLFLRTLDNAPALGQGFVDRIIEKLRILSACVVYRSKHATEFVCATSAAMAHMDEAIVAEFHLIAETLAMRPYRGVSRDEVRKNPKFSGKREELLKVFDRCSAELFLPLVYEGEVRGMVCLGAKRSGNEYSAEDLRLVLTLSEQLALSLENGRLYEHSVTALQKAEASNHRLREMDRVKKEFVANLCHELRTPVSIIIGFCDILREDHSFSANTRDLLNKLINNSQELSSLMDNLMNFSRMEADGSSTQFEIVKLREILTALEMMTQRLIRERPIEFGIQVESGVDTIESDGQKLQQILVQLLTNALKFTEKGRIELTVRQRRDLAQEMLEIAVADTGIGIRLEDQEVIFDDFRQLEGSSTRHYGGTGLGLGLCRKLAAALGGEMRVSSEYGVGSVFSLLLPVRALAPAPLGGAALL
ncbi:MAG TPA: ATP-binding protein [Candidatus Binatia bacterium]|nr:ATP-binding protein [Candidatus Binatia bacterium]